jgi:alpha-D-ribose 1-methylphosphonate 5-triphosphate synthase subunit PhnL
MKTLLTIDGLEKQFVLHGAGGKRIQALTGVSFELEAGVILGLTGQSGSGKSTLMRCIHRTYLPSAGRIHLQAGEVDLDLAVAPEFDVLAARRSVLGYCSQFLRAIPRVPAVEVAAERLIRNGVDRPSALEAARVCLDRLGVPAELWDAFPATFSGGEQQRVNVARSILGRPKLLLADEPTAALDARSKSAVIELLLELRDSGAAIILITHDRDTLSRLASRTLHLEAGRILETVAGR